MLGSPLAPIQPIIIPPGTSQATVRRIIAQKWDLPTQSIDTRSLVVWRITDSLDRVTHCLIGIAGTPWRGLVLVPIDSGMCSVRSSLTPMILTRKQTDILRGFLSEVLATRSLP